MPNCSLRTPSCSCKPPEARAEKAIKQAWRTQQGMRVTKEKLAKNRARILTAAARLFRERGGQGAGIDALMQAAGFTHGSLYSHFGSKDALLAEALKCGFARAQSRTADIDSLESAVTAYLSATHRDHPGSGCFMAAIGCEMPRQNRKVRTTFTQIVRRSMARHAALIGRLSPRREDEALPRSQRWWAPSCWRAPSMIPIFQIASWRRAVSGCWNTCQTSNGAQIMIRAQLISIITYALIAWWYVVPWLRKLDRSQALTALLWVHVFRYCVLYLFVAQREGYAISDTAVAELVIGDLAGALIAAVGIVLLRLRSRLGLLFAALVILASIADVAGGAYLRSIEPPRPDAAGVWWLIFVFFAPLIVVSLPLIVWQLWARWGEPLTHAAPATTGLGRRVTAP
jgi:TetR/AcrR family transcriptional regulator, transcriptional repressor for nem operon